MAFLFNVRYRNIAIGNAGKICFTGKEFIQSEIFAGLIQIKFGIKAEFWKLEIYISIFYRFTVLLRKNFFHAFLIEQRFQRVTLFWKDKVHGLTVHKWNLKHGVVIGFIIRTAFKFLVHIGYIDLFPVSKGKFSGCVVFCFKVVCPCTFKIESVDDGEYLIWVWFKGWIEQSAGLLRNPFCHSISGSLLFKINRVGRCIEFFSSIFGKGCFEVVVVLHPERVCNLKNAILFIAVVGVIEFI